ncbi:hypothetical protein J2Y67_000274 [Neobacillus niacini]|nr:hypothetical protein [Neobacillus niacini]
MKAALEEMKGANGNEELGEKADLQFHLTNTEAGGNPLLMSLMNHVSGLMGESMRETRKVWLFSKCKLIIFANSYFLNNTNWCKIKLFIYFFNQVI